MAPRKDLGSILVDEQVIGGKDLERVELKRRESGRPLWHALVDAKLISEDEIFFLLAQRFGAPVLADEEIEQAQVPEPLRRALTREQAIASGLLPIDLVDGRRATVVMVDPSDEQTLAAFLTRAQVPEGRAVLGRRSAIERAVDRCFGRDWAGRGHGPIHSAPTQMLASPPPRYHVDEVTGNVKLDPELAAEIARLPSRARATDDGQPPLETVPVNDPPTNRTHLKTAKERPRHKTPVPAPALDEAGERAAEERFTRVLLQAVEALAHELERRLGGAGADDSGRLGRPGRAGEMARLSRRVARQMNLGRRAVEEIGIAAQLYAVDAMMRQVDGPAASDIVFGDLGWPAAGEGGLLPILRALTAASAGFGRPSHTTPPLGARIISVVSDYLELGAAAGEADLGTVSQLLRASSAGAPVVDALLRVLEGEREDRTPESALSTEVTAAPATSLLKEDVSPGPKRREPQKE
jgi:hypothetical protein